MPLAVTQNLAVKGHSVLKVTAVDHEATPNAPIGAILADGQQSAGTVLLAVNTLPTVCDFLRLNPSGDCGALGGTQSLVVFYRDYGSTKVNCLANLALNKAWLAIDRGRPSNTAHLGLANWHLETDWLTPIAWVALLVPHSNLPPNFLPRLQSMTTIKNAGLLV